MLLLKYLGTQCSHPAQGLTHGFRGCEARAELKLLDDDVGDRAQCGFEPVRRDAASIDHQHHQIADRNRGEVVRADRNLCRGSSSVGGRSTGADSYLGVNGADDVVVRFGEAAVRVVVACVSRGRHADA